MATVNLAPFFICVVQQISTFVYSFNVNSTCYNDFNFQKSIIPDVLRWHSQKTFGRKIKFSLLSLSIYCFSYICKRILNRFQKSIDDHNFDFCL